MTNRRMLKLYYSGVSLTAIGEEAGLSKWQTGNRLQKLRWASGELVLNRKDLKKLCEEGLTIRQIAERQACSVGCIHKKLKRYGLKTKYKWGDAKRVKNKCEHDKKEASR